MSIKHSFVSAKEDNSDSSLVKPSDWNAAHTIENGTITNAMVSGDAAIDESKLNLNYATHAHTNKTTLDATQEAFTTTIKNKIDGIAEGAEVNVNADWNAVSGDAQILNKPTILSIGGSDTQIQYNSSGSFAGSANLTWNNNTNTISVPNIATGSSPTDLTVDCGSNKTILLSQYVWDDIRITPGSFDRPGSSDPSMVPYIPGGSGVTTYLYEFAKNNIASFTVQIPHGYATGENIYVHIHWTPGTRGNEENGNYVGWKIDYTWANLNGTFGSMSTADLSDACDGTDHKHQMTPDVVITGTDKGISSMLLCNVKRTDTGTDDTWVATASGQLPFLLEIDFHVPLNTIGSRQIGTK